MVLEHPTQKAEADVSTLFKKVGSVRVYFLYFLLGTNRPEGAKGTLAVLDWRSLPSGPAFPMESPVSLRPGHLLF